jgi:Mn2+/Fe2+ NRAMP family transporter
MRLPESGGDACRCWASQRHPAARPDFLRRAASSAKGMAAGPSLHSALVARGRDACSTTLASARRDASCAMKDTVRSLALALCVNVAILAIASQVVLEGFMRRTVPAWQRRLWTRVIALGPALGGTVWLGDGGVGWLLVASQVVLGLQLPFAVWPLLRLTGDRRVMGDLVSRRPLQWIAIAIFVMLCSAGGLLVGVVLRRM